MLNIIQKGLSKIFGSKSNRDVKSVLPIIDEINEHFLSYQNFTHDELRQKTQDFKYRIQQYLSEIDRQIEELSEKAETQEMELDEKEACGGPGRGRRAHDEGMPLLRHDDLPQGDALPQLHE